jgi:hypothetical protein
VRAYVVLVTEHAMGIGLRPSVACVAIPIFQHYLINPALREKFFAGKI